MSIRAADLRNESDDPQKYECKANEPDHERVSVLCRIRSGALVLPSSPQQHSFTLPVVKEMAERFDLRRSALIFAGVYAGVLAAHATLLRLPYFWDEAGYYIPLARDFFLSGDLIPTTTLSNAHPPLPVFYLALWWKLLGYSIVVTRAAMLLVASFALLQVYLLAKRVANKQVAFAATLCFAVYPVFFAQSSLAHADLPATALTLWGLRLYFEDRRWSCVVAFALAALAKETAIVTPLALFAWEMIFVLLSRMSWDVSFRSLEDGVMISRSIGRDNPRLSKAASLLIPAVPLALWFAYHYYRTGYVFGNPEFFRYNVAATLSPLRFVLAAVQRIWQAFGHMNLWMLTLAMLAAMLLPAIGERRRIAISTQFVFAVLILAHIIIHSLIGGAVLARYMMPVIPLVIIVAMSTLWRRVQEWKWVIAFVCAAFVVGWFINPPYRFSPEDNLNYADFVQAHQHAADYIQKRFPHARVLTAWPATDELTKPYLGYVTSPVRVVKIENFSFDQVILAKQNTDYDIVLLFSTKYEPPRRLFYWDFWERANQRFFDYHSDVSPEVAAEMLGGRMVMKEIRNGQWVAVVEIPTIRNAKLLQQPPRP
ncbi:MAG: hypothetical protein JWO13_1957 [Acidobacteriales bacterium]|nr:hypothetical protein [Terriglobales bacterium]